MLPMYFAKSPMSLSLLQDTTMRHFSHFHSHFCGYTLETGTEKELSCLSLFICEVWGACKLLHVVFKAFLQNDL